MLIIANRLCIIHQNNHIIIAYVGCVACIIVLSSKQLNKSCMREFKIVQQDHGVKAHIGTIIITITINYKSKYSIQ